MTDKESRSGWQVRTSPWEVMIANLDERIDAYVCEKIRQISGDKSMLNVDYDEVDRIASEIDTSGELWDLYRSGSPTHGEPFRAKISLIKQVMARCKCNLATAKEAVEKCRNKLEVKPMGKCLGYADDKRLSDDYCMDASCDHVHLFIGGERGSVLRIESHEVDKVRGMLDVYEDYLNDHELEPPSADELIEYELTKSARELLEANPHVDTATFRRAVEILTANEGE